MCATYRICVSPWLQFEIILIATLWLSLLGCNEKEKLTPIPKLIFVTSDEYTGDLQSEGEGANGLDGADKICQRSAAAANLTGTWVAWLSDDSADAISRVTGDGPWYTVDKGTLIFKNRASLTGYPYYRIYLDEYGSTVPENALAWTGTNIGGKKIMNKNCSNWTIADSCSEDSCKGVAGNTLSTSNSWTNDTAYDCYSKGDNKRLLCLEQ